MENTSVPLDRPALVTILQRRLDAEGFPRLQIALILAASGCAAFLSSALALRAGLAHMGARYAMASIAGYLMFLALIRLWIAYQRGRWEPEIDLDLVGDVATSVSDVELGQAAPSLFRGGRSGGGGASASWSPSAAPPPAPVEAVARTAKPGGGSASGLDLDELWPVVIAIGCAAFGLVAIVYTIYLAPALLAEVALDAALVTTVYRRLRKQDAGTWIGAALRRTWLPAAAVIVLMAIAGVALQYAAPDARSIGEVIRTLRG